MKTTGVAPEALAASISRLSRSEIGVLPDSPSVASARSGSLTGDGETDVLI
jgi:hypothetical protein